MIFGLIYQRLIWSNLENKFSSHQTMYYHWVQIHKKRIRITNPNIRKKENKNHKSNTLAKKWFDSQSQIKHHWIQIVNNGCKFTKKGLNYIQKYSPKTGFELVFWIRIRQVRFLNLLVRVQKFNVIWANWNDLITH